MPAASVTLRRPLTTPTNLVTRAVTRLPAGTLHLVKNRPVSVTRFPITTANLVNPLTKFPQPTTSLVTSRLTKLTKLAGAPAAAFHEKTTEVIGGLSVGKSQCLPDCSERIGSRQ